MVEAVCTMVWSIAQSDNLLSITLDLDKKAFKYPIGINSNNNKDNENI